MNPFKIPIPAVLTAGFFLTACGLSDAPEARARMNCHNNLKNIGMAVNLYSLDNQNMAPKDLLQLTNYLTSPVVLLCPGDTTKTTPKNESWSSFDPKNVSYKLVSPGARNDTTATNELVWCPIHNCVSYKDGHSITTKTKKQ
ncbi:MAG: hypothetical protein ABI042_08290 [Verrucomicrobiota bacterium]